MGYFTPPEAPLARVRCFVGEDHNETAFEILRLELEHLLRKQAKLLNARSLGEATDGEILDYELRQEVIHDICQKLANSPAA
jgi:hypothetical protein